MLKIARCYCCYVHAAAALPSLAVQISSPRAVKWSRIGSAGSHELHNETVEGDVHVAVAAEGDLHMAESAPHMATKGDEHVKQTGIHFIRHRRSLLTKSKNVMSMEISPGSTLRPSDSVHDDLEAIVERQQVSPSATQSAKYSGEVQLGALHLVFPLGGVLVIVICFIVAFLTRERRRESTVESDTSNSNASGPQQFDAVATTEKNLTENMHKTYRVHQRIIRVIARCKQNAWQQMERSTNADQVPQELASFVKRSFLHMNVGIIVSDMSGFTRLTREYGVVHFASIILRMRQVCLPIFHHFGAIHIATEADDFIVIFPTAPAAAQAAHAMQTTISKYNSSLPPKKAHFSLTLNGVGVDFGKGPVEDMHGKLFGDTFVNAYAMGEDLCQKGAVLVSGNVREKVQASPLATSVDFKQVPYDSDQMEEVAQKVNGLYEIIFDAAAPFSVPGCDDDRFLSKDLLWLTKRHSMSLSLSQLFKLDKEIKAKFLQQRTILMVNFAYEFADSVESQMRLQFESFIIIQSKLQEYNGEALENEMFAFKDPVDAVKAALDIRKSLSAQFESTQEPGKPALIINGYGIHMGEILLVPDTDVHWGDPVNTASKLGQDLAADSNILISDVTYHAVNRDSTFKNNVFVPQELHKSKVTFHCYKVLDAGHIKKKQAPTPASNISGHDRREAADKAQDGRGKAARSKAAPVQKDRKLSDKVAPVGRPLSAPPSAVPRDNAWRWERSAPERQGARERQGSPAPKKHAKAKGADRVTTK